MDPNETLAKMRAVARILVHQHELPIDDPTRIGDFARLVHGDDLASMFEDLDQWIRNHGFLPKEWKR